MTKNEKKPDIVDVLKEFHKKVIVFDKELQRLQLPYIKIANKALADVVMQTIKEIEEYRKIVEKERTKYDR